MNIYLAGSYLRHRELGEYASDLALLGHTVTSRWLRLAQDPADDGRTLSLSRLEAATIARDDLADIERSELVICFTEPSGGPGRGGRHFEAGVAYAIGRSVYVVGPIENIFYALPGVRSFSCWTACRRELIGKLPRFDNELLCSYRSEA